MKNPREVKHSGKWGVTGAISKNDNFRVGVFVFTGGFLILYGAYVYRQSLAREIEIEKKYRRNNPTEK